MIGIQLEILIIALIVSLACVLPGVFLVLRRMSLLSDAVSHAILFGIAVVFLIVEKLDSPWLMLGATLTGLVMVWLVELLRKSRKVGEDAAIGLVFPVLFSVGVILISRYAGNVHLDVDAVLLGELAYAPFERFVVAGKDLGPKAAYTMGGILIANILFLKIFYKELKLTTFDALYAASLGIAPFLLQMGLMTMVSLTAVGAFDAVGSVLVVALMIVPPASAYLLTRRLERLLLLSVGLAILGTLSGYGLARVLDASLAGSMASMTGLIFILSWVFAPGRGLIPKLLSQRNQRFQFARELLLVHLLNHSGTAVAGIECSLNRIPEHLHWEAAFLDKVVAQALKKALVQSDGGLLILTEEGTIEAQAVMVR